MLHNGAPIDPMMANIPWTVHVAKLPNAQGPPTSYGTKKLEVKTPMLPKTSATPNVNNKRCMTGNCRCDDDDDDDDNAILFFFFFFLSLLLFFFLFNRNFLYDKYIIAREPAIDRNDDVQDRTTNVEYCAVFHDCIIIVGSCCSCCCNDNSSPPSVFGGIVVIEDILGVVACCLVNIFG